ncbi:Uncharacterised protein [Mycobacteroides abscessus subsp. abscessus]|nr:Uncharacterised protein [Mycobacteroides abscessus subsp. abscessus]
MAALTCPVDGRVVLAGLGRQLLEGHQKRRRDKDRRVGTGDHTDEQGQRDIHQGTRAKGHGTDEQNRADGEKRHNRGVDRTNHRLVDREVHVLGEGVVLLLVDVRGQLTHLVEDDDSVIERVAQNRQEADHGRRRDLDLQDRKHTDGDGNVVHQRKQRRRCHAPRAEVHRHQQGDECHEDDERLGGLSGD